VLHGREHLTEFLRLRTLPGALNVGAPTTVEALRARLAKGETIEVAGYEISGRMAAALERLELAKLACPDLGTVRWFELEQNPKRLSLLLPRHGAM
jgi:hypothetical protein